MSEGRAVWLIALTTALSGQGCHAIVGIGDPREIAAEEDGAGNGTGLGLPPRGLALIDGEDGGAVDWIAVIGGEGDKSALQLFKNEGGELTACSSAEPLNDTPSAIASLPGRAYLSVAAGRTITQFEVTSCTPKRFDITVDGTLLDIALVELDEAAIVAVQASSSGTVVGEIHGWPDGPAEMWTQGLAADPAAAMVAVGALGQPRQDIVLVTKQPGPGATLHRWIDPLFGQMGANQNFLPPELALGTEAIDVAVGAVDDNTNDAIVLAGAGQVTAHYNAQNPFHTWRVPRPGFIALENVDGDGPFEVIVSDGDDTTGYALRVCRHDESSCDLHADLPGEPLGLAAGHLNDDARADVVALLATGELAVVVPK